MSILRRIKNLWRLSSIDGYYPIPENTPVQFLPQREMKKAEIITSKKNPVDEIVNSK